LKNYLKISSLLGLEGLFSGKNTAEP